MIIKVPTLCPQCGIGAPIDGEGCCATCGATATGEGVDAALAKLADLRAKLADAEKMIGRLNSEREHYRALALVKLPGEIADFRAKLAEAEEENRKLARAAELSASMACEHPCGGCSGCALAADVTTVAARAESEAT